jgi:hypothetical protein
MALTCLAGLAGLPALYGDIVVDKAIRDVERSHTPSKPTGGDFDEDKPKEVEVP